MLALSVQQCFINSVFMDSGNNAVAFDVCEGIGVPLLLAYVYGVVPISLCRSGGCGVSTTDTGGVRIDFDESNVPVETVVSPFAGKTLDLMLLFCDNFICMLFCHISSLCAVTLS